MMELALREFPSVSSYWTLEMCKWRITKEAEKSEIDVSELNECHRIDDNYNLKLWSEFNLSKTGLTSQLQYCDQTPAIDQQDLGHIETWGKLWQVHWKKKKKKWTPWVRGKLQI